MITRIKEFIAKLLSVKVVAFSLIFGVSVRMLTTGKLSGSEWITGIIALYGLLIGAREFNKYQKMRFPDMPVETNGSSISGFVRERGE